MDSVLKETLPHYRLMLKASGTWPEKNSTIFYRVYSYITSAILFVFILLNLVQLSQDYENVEKASYEISAITAAGNFFLKLCVILLKKSAFHEIPEYLWNPIFSNHEKHLDVYIYKKITFTNRLRKVLLYPSLGTLVLIAIGPLITTKPGRNLPLDVPLDMNQQSFLVYIFVWLFQVAASAIVAWGISHLDSLIFTFMWVGVAQIEILNNKILDSSVTEPAFNEYQDNSVQRNMKDCVILHTTIANYLKLIENNLTFYYLIQALVSATTICFMGFSMILVPVRSPEFIRCVFFVLSVTIELSLFCIIGNELIVQSDNVRSACYMTKWDFCSIPTRKLLYMIMERSKRPFKITAGKFMVLSYTSLLSILKATFSYFMVLVQLYKERITL